MTTALEGIRVVELAQLVSGPYCGTVLASLGADVVKIEPPGGDMARQFGPFTAAGSAYFQAVNRGKRSLFLDLASAAGRAELEQQLAQADVLIHNMRVSAARRLGVDSASLHRRHPNVVVCEISAFGTDDAAADRVGVDLVFQAESGFMRVTGHPGGPPTRAGTNVPDFFAAMSATAGILAALHERAATGVAPVVSVSLMASTIALQTCWFAAHAAGAQVEQLGNGSPFSSPTGAFPAEDREVVISIVHDRHWRRLAEILGLPEHVVDDPRFATNDLRCRNRAELEAVIAPRFRTRKAQEWVDDLRAAGLPVALAHSYDEAMAAWPSLFGEIDGVAAACLPFELRRER